MHKIRNILLVFVGMLSLLSGCSSTLVNSIQNDNLAETNKLLNERIKTKNYKENDFLNPRSKKDFLSIAIEKGYEDLAIKVVEEQMLSHSYNHNTSSYKNSIVGKAVEKKMFRLIKVLNQYGWIGRSGDHKESVSIEMYNKLKNIGNEEIANYFLIHVNDFRYNIETRYALDQNKANQFTEIIEIIQKNKIMKFDDFAEKIIVNNMRPGFSNDEHLITVMLQYLLKNNYENDAISVANIAMKYASKAEYFEIKNAFLVPSIHNLEVFDIFYKYYCHSVDVDIALEAAILNNSIEPLKIYEDNVGIDKMSNFLNSKLVFQSIKNKNYTIANYLLSKNIDFSEADKFLDLIINTKNKELISKINNIQKLPAIFVSAKEIGISCEEIPNWLNEFNSEEAAVWMKTGFDLQTAVTWNKKIPIYALQAKPLYILAFGLYKKMGATNPERASLYFQYKITDKNKILAIENSIKLECKNHVFEYTKLREMNPYEAKGQCFWFEGNRFQTISKNRGLYAYGNIFTDITFVNYAAGNFIGIVKGTGVTELQDGSQIPKTKVIQTLN